MISVRNNNVVETIDCSHFDSSFASFASFTSSATCSSFARSSIMASSSVAATEASFDGMPVSICYCGRKTASGKYMSNRGVMAVAESWWHIPLYDMLRNPIKENEVIIL